MSVVGGRGFTPRFIAAWSVWEPPDGLADLDTPATRSRGLPRAVPGGPA
jgi:hypothetical protein